MADTVVVFNRLGRALSELNVSVERHLKMDHTINPDRGSFRIPVQDPKATEANLRRGNYIYVTSDQTGIAPWCAMIWPNAQTGLIVDQNAEITVPLVGAEYLLQGKMTAAVEEIKTAASPGQLFTQLLTIAQRSGAIPPLSQSIQNIDPGGATATPTWNLQDCYSIINQLSNDNEMYWGFAASRDFDFISRVGTGALVLTPFFNSRNGVNKRSRRNIIARSGGGSAGSGDGANLVGSSAREGSSHPFANQVIAYGKMKDWTDNIIYTADDPVSQGLYGVFSVVLAKTNLTTVADLIPVAVRELRLCAPRLYVDGTLINVSTFPRIGDLALVQPDYSGCQWLADRWKTTLTMRVIETAYTPVNNTMAVNLEAVLDGEQ